jgi:hypothetical protein
MTDLASFRRTIVHKCVSSTWLQPHREDSAWAPRASEDAIWALMADLAWPESFPRFEDFDQEDPKRGLGVRDKANVVFQDGETSAAT